MTVNLQEIESDDQSALWEALYIALWDPPDGPRRPKSCLNDPNISLYARDWGSKEMDIGFKSVTREGAIAGMIWCRLIPNRADAYWDDNTPQLGLAVFPEFQGHGIGPRLMKTFSEAAVNRIPGVSLGVHPENNVAIRLYEKFGFKTFATASKGYLHMHRHFRSENS